MAISSCQVGTCRGGKYPAITLQNDTVRYRFNRRPRVREIGLRLKHVRKENLEDEAVQYRRAKKDPRIILRQYGATAAECDFLAQPTAGGWQGRRVELNAMKPALFIDFLERKLRKAGVEKVVPDPNVLAHAYQRAVQGVALEVHIERQHQALINQQLATVPDTLAKEVRRRVQGTTKSWDEVIAEIARENTPIA
jgi:hypothetical protein